MKPKKKSRHSREPTSRSANHVSFGEFASPLSVLCNHCFTHLQRSSQQNARLLNERASPRLAGREEGAKARRRQAARWTRSLLRRGRPVRLPAKSRKDMKMKAAAYRRRIFVV